MLTPLHELFMPPLAFLDGAIGPVLLLLFWAVRAILTANAEAKQRRALETGEAVGEPAPQDDAVRSELEEFLARMRDEPEGEDREAIGQRRDDRMGGDSPDNARPQPAREARMAPLAPPGGRVIEVFDDEPEPEGVRRPIDPFLEPQRQTAAKAEAVATRQSQPTTQPTPASVEIRHLPESQLAENAAHLGERIASADDRVRARLAAKFGKSVSQQDAEAKALESETADTTAAARIAAALSTPTGVRDAVILNEILRPPSDRW